MAVAPPMMSGNGIIVTSCVECCGYGLAVCDVFDVFGDGCYGGDAGEYWYEWEHVALLC